MFQLSHLRSFVAVATELHFGRAAALLNMTQPPLTRHIQLLEHEVGVQLLDRSGGAVRLTPAGAIFLREAEDILRRSQAAKLAARRAMRADAGSVSMGFIPAASFALLPQLLGAIRSSLPEVHVSLREMQTDAQLEAIAADRIELGLVRPFAPRSFVESAPLLREPFVLAAPAGHPLLQAERLPLSALEGQPFIEFCRSESRYLYEIVAGRLRAEGVAPDTVQTLSHTHSILSLVDAGMGVALVPQSAWRLGYAGVRFRPIDDQVRLDVELHLVWRRGNPHWVAATVRQVMEQAFDTT
ncbi:LysR family transcriptional regulator [Cupriavidus gilardii]|uniref:LysR family transcriptional regulator n=1 Tax=Cupriavidus gilardii TaxID=82541 RepID=A0A849B8K8_9BURK|nr:LysR family transcriptional regulator [Cupriavidus gilardii]KAB0599497.1 LysR family transcriptional regulator [Cupriavidus gilardii]NNH10756.1 LysR family transcriptional regulator [Cupriavidus gilardii]